MMEVYERPKAVLQSETGAAAAPLWSLARSAIPKPLLVTILRSATVALACFVCLGIVKAEEIAKARSSGAPPNFILILIDDLGWADLPCYGNTFHETPAIDRLVASGMRFTDFYAAAPVCSPARASLLSGQYPARLGLTDFVPGHWRPFERVVAPPIIDHLPLEIDSLAEVLKRAGYATGYFGKWHLGGAPEHHPLRHGFDEAIVTRGRHIAPHFMTIPKTPVEEGKFLTEFLTDRTLGFIDKHKSQPFFAFVSHFAVHIPLEAKTKDIEKYASRSKPDHGPGHPIYAAMVDQIDQSVRRITEKLDEHGLSDNTIILFTSDNGGLHKIYTGVGEVVTSNAPLRGEKGSLYEGGIRVPLIVRWPGKIKPGTVSAVPASTVDLLPTLAMIAGEECPTPVDGESLVPVLVDSKASLERKAIFFHYPHYHHARPASAIRQGKWKLIENLDDRSVNLFNLAEDVGETNDLADAEEDRAGGLRNKLAAWRESVGAKMPTANPKYDPDRAEQWWSRRQNKPLAERP